MLRRFLKNFYVIDTYISKSIYKIANFVNYLKSVVKYMYKLVKYMYRFAVFFVRYGQEYCY